MKKRRYANENKFYGRVIFLLLLVCAAAAALMLSTRLPADTQPGSGASLGDAVSSGLFAELGASVPLEQNGGETDLSLYPQELQELYYKNPEARSFVLDYFEKRDGHQEVDLSSLKGSDQVPLLMQWDERWGYEQYAGGLMGLTGCGPTCLSMAAIYLLDDPSLDPYTVAQFATENGYATDGDGTYWTLFSEGCLSLGLTSRQLPLNKGDIDLALEGGELVACIMGPGDFTTSGHYILLTGIENGEYTVNDSNSRENSQKTWSYEDISGQIRNLWALGAG